MDNEYVLGPNGELYHHGTKGMRWGIRRYQNKDGSLTPAGKKRYKSTEEELKAREKVIKNKERARAKLAKLEAKKAELDAREKALEESGKSKINTDAPKQKSIKDMSDEELSRVVNRSRLEAEYARLHPKQKTLLQTIGEKALNEVLIPSVTSVGKSYADKMISKYTKSEGPSIDDLLKKYGDVSDAEYDRYERAAKVKGWADKLLGKKDKDK